MKFLLLHRFISSGVDQAEHWNTAEVKRFTKSKIFNIDSEWDKKECIAVSKSRSDIAQCF